MAVATGITIEEFERLPEALARNHELVDGELVKTSGNTSRHNRPTAEVMEIISENYQI